MTVAIAYGRDELLEAFRATIREAIAAGTPAEQVADCITADSLAAALTARVRGISAARPRMLARR